MQVEAIGIGGDHLQAVLALYRRHVDTLGFMPQGAFESRAASGTLLVANEGPRLCGYLLYDLPDRHIAIRHLCVRASERKKGVAKLLVENLVARHPERRGILLSCRNDFPAAALWPRLDFEPVRQIQGRSRKGHLLTKWWRDFGHPTLFTVSTGASAPVLTAALDTDVFLDLVSPEVRSHESRHLLDDWVREHVQLFITKEISVELQEPTRHRGSALPRRDAPAMVWEPIAQRLRAVLASRGQLTDHDERDVRHVARAAAVGASFFLTRDDDLLRRLSGAARDAGIQVSTPGDFMAGLDASAAYAPVLLENTTFSLRPAAGYGSNELVAKFLNYGSGEKANRLGARIRAAGADKPRSVAWVVADEKERPVAVYAQSVGTRVLEVPLLRVAGPLASTLSRHLAYLQRQQALQLDLSEVRITDDMVSAPLPAALAAEGFTPDSGSWFATPRTGLLRMTDLAKADAPGDGGGSDTPERVRAAVGLREVSPELAAELERQFSPLKLVGAGITTYLVPIKPQWAAQLFDSALSEGTLFGRDVALGVSREHVYYSSALLRPRTPARLLWYVSGDPKRHPGAGAVRAVAALDEAVVDRPRTLYRRYQHLGVWTLKEVAASARKDGKVLALRFSDTSLFKTPVKLATLQALSREAGHTLFLQSLSEMPEHLFASIYERGADEPN